LRFVLVQMRHRAARTVALVLGILVASASFTVLTGAARTGQLQVVGKVRHNFRSAYDILVRPPGSVSALERRRHLVRQNYLSDIFGGISVAQYHRIQQVPGVQVAAPIAMLGYVFQTVRLPIDLTAFIGHGRRALFEVRVDRSSDRGLLRFPGAQRFYVYVTHRPIAPENGTAANAAFDGPKEKLASGARVTVCPQVNPRPGHSGVSGPFDPTAMSFDDCWSTQTGLGGGGWPQQVRKGHVAALLAWPFPFLVAAVDPAAEARLSGLRSAMVQGHFLREGHGARETDQELRVPVLVSTKSFTDDVDHVTVRRLSAATARAMPHAGTPQQVQHLLAGSRGAVVLRKDVDTDTAYQAFLHTLSANPSSFVDNYWTAGPVRYRRYGDVLEPVPVSNPRGIWRSRFQATGWVHVPTDAQVTGFRTLQPHVGSNTVVSGPLQLPVLQAVGRFDPDKIPGFGHLNRVPLQTYNPPQARPADARTARLLGGRPLLPNGNIAGYLQAPPLLLTTLSSIPAFTDPGVWSGHLHTRAPISVVRVRVSGVTGPDQESLARIRQVAEQITQRTGLRVDITAGSSPTPMTVRLPAGSHGRPALTLTEGWVDKGVAVRIITAMDRKSLALFALVFVVCGLFVANAAAASVRSRRRELGILACLGWPTRRLFSLILTELALVGLVGGAAGTAVAIPIAHAAGLSPSPVLAGIATPASLLLAVAAGLFPAARASRSNPIDAVRPTVSDPGRSTGHVSGIASLARAQARRVPGRTAMAAAALAVGVAGLTILVALTTVFRGAVVGSRLGNAVAVPVRGIDYLAIAVILLLGVGAVADVLYLNIRERGSELATLAATGWADGALTRLITVEGAIIGLLGGLAGAAIGMAATAWLGGRLTFLIPVAVACAAAGPVLTTLAALLPAALLRRIPVAALIAEE
jgi:hypothetical protein